VDLAHGLPAHSLSHKLRFSSAHGCEDLALATVLIVDDEAQILVLAQSFLEEQGHKTLLAATRGFSLGH
jgi:hypothetical protein